MGPALPLVPFGIARTVRQQGLRFVLVLASCLGFITVTWVFRSSLGLDRHFVAVVPLYAVFAAQGAATIADAVSRLWRRLSRKPGTADLDAAIGRITGGALSAASFGLLLSVLVVWMGFWRSSIERGFPERQALGRYLRTLPHDAPIFCDDATIEILSGLDRRRFDRHWVDDPHTWDLVEEAARARGVAYVATWRRKLVGHEQAGRMTFAAGGVAGDASTGVAALRIQAPTVGAGP
jgi:hypothetical protein